MKPKIDTLYHMSNTFRNTILSGICQFAFKVGIRNPKSVNIFKKSIISENIYSYL